MLDNLSFEHNELSKLLWTAALVGLFFCFGASIAASDEFWIIDNQIKDARVDYQRIQQKIQLQSANDLVVDDLVVDDLVVDDLVVDDLAVDDLAVDDLAVDDLAVDDLAVDDLSAERDKAENKIAQLRRQSAEVVARHKLYKIGSAICLTLFLSGLAWWYIGPYQRKKRDSELATKLLELEIEIKEKELERLYKD